MSLSRLFAGYGWLRVLAVASTLLAAPDARAGSVDVPTYHLDAQRTGWNANETVLNWSNVNASQFGLLRSIALDEQVDAQPLIVSAATIAAAGGVGYPNDVAIVVTENNTVYEIDSGTGAIIRSRNLGTPVAMTNLPGSCNNNSAVVGITSTPVLDLTNFYMYAVTYTWENAAPVYRLHKLSLVDLSDVSPSVVIGGTAALSDGSTVTFQPQFQRQRAALLASQGNVYAAFSSFCDFYSNISRGWLFAYKAQTMALVGDGIATMQTAAQAGAGTTSYGAIYYLSSIWGSGYGPSADAYGNVYLATGNSSGSNASNYGESVLKIAPNVDALMDYFKPANFASLDYVDLDMAAGGVMVAPDQPGGAQFVVATGKDGRMFLMNRNGMGGYTPGGPDVPSNVTVGNYCWCGPSYFVGSDGKARIVSSGDTQAMTWLLPSTVSGTLSHEATSPSLPVSAQDPGFQTFVSSNGQQAQSAIVWATSRAVNGNIWLYAFEGDGGLGQLFSAQAGAWTSAGNNANAVPVAAGGKVYVASYKALSIFGQKSASGGGTTAAKTVTATAAALPAPKGGARYYGAVKSVVPAQKRLQLTLKGGASLTVNLATALADHTSVAPVVGENLKVEGAMADGVLNALTVTRAKGPANWGANIP